jgi:hypothetical protein
VDARFGSLDPGMESFQISQHPLCGLAEAGKLTHTKAEYVYGKSKCALRRYGKRLA